MKVIVDHCRSFLVLVTTDLDLDKATEMIKASQVTHSRASEIAGEISSQEDVSAVKHKSRAQEKGKPRKSSTRNPIV